MPECNDVNMLHYVHYAISGLPSSGACYAYTAPVPRGEGAAIATETAADYGAQNLPTRA